jgi:hypothetical protein
MEQPDNSESTNKARDTWTHGPTAFEAAQLIKPPAPRGGVRLDLDAVLVLVGRSISPPLA